MDGELTNGLSLASRYLGTYIASKAQGSVHHRSGVESSLVVFWANPNLQTNHHPLMSYASASMLRGPDNLTAPFLCAPDCLVSRLPHDPKACQSVSIHLQSACQSHCQARRVRSTRPGEPDLVCPEVMFRPKWTEAIEKRRFFAKALAWR